MINTGAQLLKTSYFTSVVPVNFINLLAVPVRAYLFPQEVDFNDLELPIHFPRRETEQNKRHPRN